MTPEHLDDQSEELAPPATTRWEGGAVEDETELLPPYVPGQARDEAGPAPVEPAEAAASEEAEPFPFEVPFGEDPGEDVAAETAGAEAPAGETVGETVDDWAVSDEPDLMGGESEEFPFDAFEIEGEGAASGAGAGVAEPWEESERESGPEAEAEPAPWAGEWAQAETEPETAAETGAETEPAADQPASYQQPASLEDLDGGTVAEPSAVPEVPTADDVLDEVAERLEALAAALRREGESALDRESREGDRLGSVLAGLLSGYLAGRGRS